MSGGIDNYIGFSAKKSWVSYLVCTRNQLLPMLCVGAPLRSTTHAVEAYADVFVSRPRPFLPAGLFQALLGGRGGKGRQADRQVSRHSGTHAFRKEPRQIDRQIDRQTDRRTDRQATNEGESATRPEGKTSFTNASTDCSRPDHHMIQHRRPQTDATHDVHD